MPPYKERVASVPNPIAKLPPLGTAAEMDKRVQGLRDMLEAQNASMAEDSYIEIDAHMSSTVLFPNVKEDLLSSDALWSHHETSVAKVCPSICPSVHHYHHLIVMTTTIFISSLPPTLANTPSCPSTVCQFSTQGTPKS
jgi:hypothetical protein